MILSALLHILVKECPHVDLTTQELLLGVLCLAIRCASFLVNTWDNILLGVWACTTADRGCLGEQHLVLFQEALVLGELLIIFIPDCLKLLLLLTVLIYLLLKLRLQSLDRVLKLLDLGLPEVEIFELVLLWLILLDLLHVHAIDLLTKLSKLGFGERDLLAAISLLLLELDRVWLLSLSTVAPHVANATELLLLHQRLTDNTSHWHLLRHGRIGLELVMDGLYHGS